MLSGRAPWVIAAGVAGCLGLLTACSGADVATDAGPPINVGSKPPGTTKTGRVLNGGLAASISSAGDPRAAQVGALIDIHLPKPDETTTTVEETTTTATIAKPPPTTPKITAPPTTPAPTLPPTLPPTVPPPPSKPAPTPLAVGSLSAEEQLIFANLGTSATLETYATALARQHSPQMAAAHDGTLPIAGNLPELVAGNYGNMSAVVFATTGKAADAGAILKQNYGSILSGAYTYIGIAAYDGLNPAGTQKEIYITIVVGNAA